MALAAARRRKGRETGGGWRVAVGNDGTRVCGVSAEGSLWMSRAIDLRSTRPLAVKQSRRFPARAQRAATKRRETKRMLLLGGEGGEEAEEGERQTVACHGRSAALRARLCMRMLCERFCMRTCDGVRVQCFCERGKTRESER